MWLDRLVFIHSVSLSHHRSCLNNGTCVDGINRFFCRCRHGFSGQFCQFELNECDSQPCKNGGTCIDGLGTFRCTCPMMYNGKTCEVRTVCPVLEREHTYYTTLIVAQCLDNYIHIPKLNHTLNTSQFTISSITSSLKSKSLVSCKALVTLWKF